MVLSSVTPLLQAQDTRNIRFRDEAPGLKLQHYRIATIKDDRADTASIGTLRAGLFGKKNVTVNFEQGVTTAVQRYIQKNFAQDTAGTPVELHITDLNIKEVPGGLRTNLNSMVTLTFYANGTKLTDYKGRGEVQTMGDIFKHVEDVIRQSIRNSLQDFDGWWGTNKMLYAADAPIVLIVDIERDTQDTTLIAWSPSRPLTVTDFTGVPDELSMAAAQTASRIGLSSGTDVVNGQIRVNVVVSPYFDNTRSWFGEKYRTNAGILAHEQRHFDITALKACELADTLRQLKLTKENYQKKLDQIYVRIQLELNAMQVKYDTETRHGTLVAAQEKWNKLLQGLLAAQSCYK